MTLTPLESEILEIIKEDIKKNPKGFSTITNNEISKATNVSVFSICDKIGKLVTKRAIQRVTNHWDEEKNYFPRIIYIGMNAPK